MKTVYQSLRNFVPIPVTNSFQKWLCSVGVMLLIAVSAQAQITGTVYRDFNANGQKDSNAEIGVGGVTVTVYRSDGTVANTGTTSSTAATIGQYSLIVSGSSSYRIEFSNFPTGYYSGPKGSSSGTSVQFASSGTSTANLGINYPSDYCETNPKVAIPCYVNGDPLINISDNTKEAGLEPVLVSFPYNSSGSTAPAKMALGNQMGSVWGLAYQKGSNLLFASALMKRHVGFGSGGPGAVYKVTNANASSGFVTSEFFKLSNYGIDAGADPHSGLSGNKAVSSLDNASFDAVGRVGIGDIDLSDDGKTMFLVNLKDKKLYSFAIGNPGIAPANENAADQTGNIRSYTIPNPACSNSESVPFGLKFFHGKLYVGVVCTAQTSQNKADLKATVYEFDPATGAFTNVLFDNSNNAAFSLNFKRGSVFCDSGLPEAQADWRPWRTTNVVIATDGLTAAESCVDAVIAYAQPILSDIEFDVDGSMIVGFADRFGNQSGRENEDKNGDLFSGFSQGDILRAGPVQGGWKIENNGTANSVAGGGVGNQEGPGGGEFYGGNRSGGSYSPTGDEAIDHAQSAQGGIGVRLGSGEVMTNILDPSFGSTDTFWAGGIRRLSNTTGLKNNDDYVLYENTDPLTGGFGKANGLGDIEVLCGLASIEIGNRLWNDADGDGVQDAGEAGINGVTVLLFKKDANGNFTNQVASQTTTGNGEYYFTSLEPNTDYQIRVLTGQNPLTGLKLTQEDAGSNDAIDSDAILDNNLSAATIVLKSGDYGQNNHTYDIGFNNCPTVTATGSAVCVGGTLSLSATGTNISTYSWSGPAAFSASTATPTRTNATTAMSGTYSVTVANQGGCKATATVTATVNPAPVVTAASNTPLCVGGTISLSATGGTSYSWTGPNAFSATGANPTRANATGSMSGTYSVTVTNSNSCTASATTSVTVNALPAISTFSFTACEGGTITISASATGALGYSWEGPGNFSSTLQKPTRTDATSAMAGTYTVTVISSTSCTASATVTVAVTPAPELEPQNASFCPGGSVTLSASGGVTYSWSTGETTSSITVTKGGTYTVTIRNQDGCKASASFVVTEKPKPTVNPTSNSPVCLGDAINLSASGGGTYLWAGPANFTSTLSAPIRANATTSMQGVYSVYVTGVNSCTNSATISVSVNVTTATASANGPVCIGTTIQLSSTGGGTYSWAGPDSFAATTQNPTRTGATSAMAGVYTVTVLKNNCPATATVSVAVNSQGAQASSNFPICSGGSINLSASAGATYSWTGPGGFSATIQNPTRANATTSMSGVYSVTVQGQNSCSGTATVSVSVNAKPTATASSNGPVCLGGSITLSATGGTSYSWTGPSQFGSTIQFPTRENASTDMSGIYTVTVRDANECTATATTSVLVNVTTPTAAANSPVCEGGVIQLSASGGGTYAWSGPGGFAATTQNPTRTGATTAMFGTYTVTVTKNNCPATATVSVVINTQGATASANSPVCEGTNIQLSASLGATYSWTGPGGFTSSERSPVRPNATTAMQGVYFVTVSGANNSCTGLASVSVAINPKPDVTVESNSPACVGGAITLTATGGGSYSWAGPAAFTATIAEPTRSNATTAMAGIYTVTVTDENKCSATATTSVKVSTAKAEILANSPVCVGGAIKLSATGGETYSWSGPNGFAADEQNPSIAEATTDEAGVYTVTVYTKEQCSATATVSVKINTQGATASSNSPVCLGGSISLSGSSGGTGATYSWTGPANFSSTIQNPTRANATSGMAGVYTITVSGKEGCTGTATTSVEISPKPTITVSSNTPVCENSLLTLSASGGDSYSWAGPANFSSTLQNPSREEATTAMAGVYSVTVKSELGCTNSGTTSVSVRPLPSFDAEAVSPTCKDKELLDNGQLIVKNVKNGNRVGYSVGDTYNGPNYSGATAIPNGGVIVSNLVNPDEEQTYTIRIFNGSNDCYTDVKVTLKPGTCKFGSIGDYVWKDLNRNGIQDQGEPAVPGVKVELYATDANGTPQGSALEMTTTDSEGKYLFDSLISGDYKVKFIVPAGMDMSLTTPNQGDDSSVDSDANTSTGFSGKVTIDVNGEGIEKDNPTIDAGLVFNYGSIGDFVWKDTDKDGIQDSNELGVKDVKVILYEKIDGAFVKVDSTLTNGAGKYLFDSLLTGTYKVQFDISDIQDCIYTDVNEGSDPSKDSDAGTGGFSGEVKIDTSLPEDNIGRNNPTIDAGLIIKCVKPEISVTPDQVICEGAVISPFNVAEPDNPFDLKVQWYGLNSTATLGSILPNEIKGSYLPEGEQLPSADGKKYFYGVVATRGDKTCADTAFVALTINPRPILEVISDKEAICVGDSVELSAKTNLKNAVINWFTNNTEETPFATTKSGESITVKPIKTTTYYVEAVSREGCKSDKTPVTVIVNAKPNTPTCSGSATNVCPATTVDLTKLNISELSIPGGKFEWHTSADPTSPLVKDPTKVGKGNYYLFEKSPAGCYSEPHLVVVNINKCSCEEPPMAMAGDDQKLCAGDTIRLKGSYGGTAAGAIWSSTTGGTFGNPKSLITYYLPSAQDIVKGKVTITLTTIDNDPDDACEPVSDALMVTICPLPKTPYNLTCSDSTLCLGYSTKLFAVSPGAKIRWYDAETGGNLVGTVDSGEGFSVSPTSTTTYWAEAVSLEGCSSPMRSPIEVKVKKCYADLAVVKTVSPSPKYQREHEITYTLVVSNNGPVNAADVKVIDKLPAGLTFVSAIPPAVYNATTGVWTVGTLTVGSNKVLEIKAKINEMDIITNVAYVTSPDNDLTKTHNDTSSVTISSIEKADLSLKKYVSNETALTGDTLTYKIVVSNAGGCIATNVKVKDYLPGNVKFVSSSSFTQSAGVLTASIAKIDSGASVTLTFKAKIVEEGKFTNCAEVYAMDQLDTDSTPGNGTNNEEDDEDCATTTAKDPCNAKPPVLSCTDCLNICAGQKVVLYADGCEGTVEWSTGETGPSIVVTPTATTTYSAECVISKKCRSEKVETTIKVGNPKPPVVTCSDAAICYGGKVNLTAAGCNGEIIWSNGYAGSVITVKPKETTTFFAYCKVGNCLSGKSNEQTVTVTPPITKPTTVDLVNDCPVQTVDLYLGVTSAPVTKGGVFEFHTGTEPTSPLVSNSKKVSKSGTYYVFEKSVIGCYSEVCTIHVLITDCNPTPPCVTNPATADAGSDATICNDQSYKLKGKIGGAATSAKWSTSGKGTFDNPLTLDATYAASAEDIAAGYVWLKLTTNDPDGSGGDCKAAADSMKLTINMIKDKPYITFTGSLHLCSGDSVKLTANPSGYKYLWSTGETIRSIYAKKSGIYNVRLVDSKGCISAECEPIEVKVAEPVPTPQCKSNVSNDCPATTVDLTKAITSQPATVGGVFEYHTGASASSPLLLNPTAVSQSGTYYLFEKSGAGCYSLPMPITVGIIACEIPKPGADLSLTKKVNVAQALVGTEVVYQLIVRNLGPDTAKNIVVTDVLPAGVQYLYSTGVTPASYSNGTLKASFAQLAKGDSAKVSFIVKVSEVGNIVNTAKITASDILDPNGENNSSTAVFKGIVKDSVISINANIGLAKSVASVTQNNDGSHDVTYRLILRHYGNANVSHVQMVDSLLKTFPADSGVTFKVIAAPSVNASSKLKVNPAFNGDTDVRLVIADESSVLKAGTADTLMFTVQVTAPNQTRPFLNTAYVSGKCNGIDAYDVSTDGMDPDLNNNGSASDAGESEPTPLLLSVTGADGVFIPEGFSPNGDGVNDTFVIKNVPGELTVDLQVFNIWGVLVFSEKEYKNNWTGNANIGSSIGAAAGLPDGTYYYLVQLSDGRRYIRFFTLAR